MYYDEEWEWYIGKLYSNIISNTVSHKLKNIVELAPGYRVKIANALKDINFTGTLYVIDNDKNVLEFIQEEYNIILPEAKIVTINKNFVDAIELLPMKIDLFLSNHSLDDIMISQYIKYNVNDIYLKDKLKKGWEQLYFNKNKCNEIINNTLKMFGKLFKEKNVKYIIMSQYKSNVFLKDLTYENEIVDKCFNKIKKLVNIDKDLQKYLNYYPFGNDERYLGEELLNNTQHEKHWICGALKEDVNKIINILKDEYYGKLYEKYEDIGIIDRAGFINYDEDINYKLNLLTTPFNKINKNISKLKNPVVLLSTGGFCPMHNGHLEMMTRGKEILEKHGYNVVGAYFSPSHEDYVSTKKNYQGNVYKRLKQNNEHLLNNNWIMLDPWECLYNNRYINFTVVIDRLEKYLQKHIDERIQVAYVCGDDNIYFMHCFEEKGIGICLNRCNEEFNDIAKEIKGPNIYYVDNNRYKRYSARKFRNSNYDSEDIIMFNNNYIIRNEGILPFKFLEEKYSEKEIKKAQEYFLEGFKEILTRFLPKELQIKIINVKDQISQASLDIKTNTISLDSYYDGTHNLEIGRLFALSEYQKSNIKIIERPGSESMIKQIRSLSKGRYTLVDDDSVSGSTIKEIKKLLPIYVNIDDVYLMTSQNRGLIYDVIDLRDFILGANNSGLICELPNKDVIRVPYIVPYVNLHTRANIEKQKEFTNEILALNYKMYKNYFPNVRLENVDENFIKLMKINGYKNLLMTDIIKLLYRDIFL